MSSFSIAVLSLALAASPTVNLEHHGTLREALQALAKQGNLNLVATGNLDIPAEVMLHDASPEDALLVVAQAYDLKVTQKGKMFVLSPNQSASVAPVPPVGLVPPVAATPPTPAMKVPPMPPMPPTPMKDHGVHIHIGKNNVNIGTDDGDDDKDEAEPADSEETHQPGSADSADTAEAIRDAAERARDRAQEARDRAEEAKEQAEEIRQAQKERDEALKEEEAAHREELKQRIELNGKDRSAVSTGPVTVAAGSRVREAVSYGGPVKVEAGGRVEGDAVAFGGDVVLEAGARVDGDAVSFGGKIVKGVGAVVHGQEVAFGSKGLGPALASGAVDAVKVANPSDEGSGRHAVAGFLVQFAVFFGLGFLFLMFAPARMRTIEAEIKREPLKNGLAGFVALLASIPLTFVLAITIIGIPVAVFFWLAAGLAVIAGLIAVSNVVGERLPLFKKRRTQALVLGIGLFAVLLASRVPVLGPLMMSVATMVALGAIIRTRAGVRGQGLPIPDGINPGVPVA